MGAIAELVKAAGATREALPRHDQGARLWRQIFGTTKEGDESVFPSVRRADSYGRTSLSSPEAYKRLLQAMRSKAPGGWSDNRWEQTKHFTGIQYIAIHRTGEQMAQSELKIYKRDDNAQDGKRPISRKLDREAWRLWDLLDKPNHEDCFGELMYDWNLQMDLTGMALTWMVPSLKSSWIEGKGEPMELYSIPTALAIPQPAVNPDYPDGYYRIQPVYPYGPFSSYPTPATAVGAPIPAQWMLRFRYRHPLLRYDGWAPLSALRLHLDEVEGIDKSRWYKMLRSINPEAVLNFENIEGMQPLTDAEIDRIRAEFENEAQGPQNHGRLYVGTAGAKLEAWGQSPKEMDYPHSWEQLVSFAMAGFGITKPAAGMIEDSSYASLFATLKQLYLLTILPKCNRIARQLTRHLAPFFGDDLIIEIKPPRIDDHEVMNAKLGVLMQGKAIKKGELRKELDMPVTGEDWEDEFAGEGGMEEQLQMQQAMGGAPAEQGAPPEKEPVPAEAQGPDTGDLGQGALGPRKSLHRVKGLDFYGRLREEMANGHAPTRG